MNHSSPATRCRSLSRGFTMIEVVTSLAIASILMLAIGSAMLLASRALPSVDGVAASTLSAANAVDKMAAELRFALQITELTSTSIRFTVPDRDGDGKPEIIRYAWSGQSGAALTRQYNSTSAAVFLPSIAHLELSSMVHQLAESYPGPYQEGSQVLLASFRPPSGSYSSSAVKIDKDKWPGQSIPIVTPTNANGYRVTRIDLQVANGAGSIEPLGIQLFRADSSGFPTGSMIQQVDFNEPTSNTYVTLQAQITNPVTLSSGNGIAVVVTNVLRSGVAGAIEYAKNGGGGLLTGSPSLLLGTTYSKHTSDKLIHEVYGRYSLPSTRTLQRTVMTGVRLTLQTSSETHGRVETAIRLPNQPEVVAACWETDFSSNPTTVDQNVDGLSDWSSATGFDTSRLSNGIWRADRTLSSNPANSFTEFTTVEVAMRDTTAGGNGAGIEMRVEANAHGHGIIEAYVARQGDNTQTLTLQTRDLLLLPKVLFTLTGLPADMVQLKLYINPANDSIGVVANGVSHGSYNYNRSVDLSNGVIRIFNTSLENGAEFDHIKVRVGGTP